MKLQVNPIHKYIAEGEHQQQDFKFCINDSRKIAKTLVAFANTDGGRLLIGVKDNGNIVGVRSEEEYYMVEAAANIYSKPKVAFEPQVWDVDGKKVLEVVIQPSADKPHFAQCDDGKWMAYIRRKDENVLANQVLLKAWALAKSQKGLLFSYDGPRKTLIDFLSIEKRITLSKFTRIAHITRMQAENILAELLFLNCIAANFETTPVEYSLNEAFDLNRNEPQ
jgi:predicted HTH transcriptional regulator